MSCTVELPMKVQSDLGNYLPIAGGDGRRILVDIGCETFELVVRYPLRCSVCELPTELSLRPIEIRDILRREGGDDEPSPGQELDETLTLEREQPLANRRLAHPERLGNRLDPQ